jgi:hypothetical protein
VPREPPEGGVCYDSYMLYQIRGVQDTHLIANFSNFLSTCQSMTVLPYGKEQPTSLWSVRAVEKLGVIKRVGLNRVKLIWMKLVGLVKK